MATLRRTPKNALEEGLMEVNELGSSSEQQPSAWKVAINRFLWLSGLLMVQSLSSIVLEARKEVLKDHIVITLFLTMLVGAGGNAGSQVAVGVIRFKSRRLVLVVALPSSST